MLGILRPALQRGWGTGTPAWLPGSEFPPTSEPFLAQLGSSTKPFLQRTLIIYCVPRGKGDTEDEMAVWHHPLDGHEFEQALGVGEGQGSLVCCSPWSRKQSGTTE